MQGIRFLHGSALQLEGDALLPLDVWQAWPNTNLATLLNDATVSKIHLTAKDLDLHAASQLTGWNFPIEGTAAGELTAEGPLGAIVSHGQFSLSQARLPLGWTGVVLNEVTAAGSLDAQKLTLTKLAGRLPNGDVQVTGDIDFTNLRDPLLKLAATSARSELALFPRPEKHAPGLRAALALTLAINGPGSSPLVSGEARMLALDPVPTSILTPDLTAVMLGSAPLELPDVVDFPSGPWNAWRFNIACPPAAVALGTTTTLVRADVRLVGTIADPALLGTVHIGGATAFVGEQRETVKTSGHYLFARIGSTLVSLGDAVLEFREGAPHDPSLTLKAAGFILGESFVAEAAGPLSRLIRFFVCDPPLTDELLRAQFGDGSPIFQPHISVLSPAAQLGGVEVFEWAPIDSTPAPGPAKTPVGAPQ